MGGLRDAVCVAERFIVVFSDGLNFALAVSHSGLNFLLAVSHSGLTAGPARPLREDSREAAIPRGRHTAGPPRGSHTARQAHRDPSAGLPRAHLRVWPLSPLNGRCRRAARTCPERRRPPRNFRMQVHVRCSARPRCIRRGRRHARPCASPMRASRAPFASSPEEDPLGSVAARQDDARRPHRALVAIWERPPRGCASGRLCERPASNSIGKVAPMWYAIGSHRSCPSPAGSLHLLSRLIVIHIKRREKAQHTGFRGPCQVDPLFTNPGSCPHAHFRSPPASVV